MTFKLQQALLDDRWLLRSMIVKLIAMLARLLVLFIIRIVLHQIQMRKKVLLEVIKADSFCRWIEQIVFTEVLLDLVYAKGHPLSHYNAS